MKRFKEILNAGEGGLLQIFHKFEDEQTPRERRLKTLEKKLRLRQEQIVCAVGFNPNARQLTEIFPILGFETFDALARQRNDCFTTDIYKRLTLDNILSIYAAVKNDPETLQVMQYLLKKRLESIEGKIEATVNSMIIEKYKAEMRTIYNDSIATIEFTEERLDRHDSGFRALLNEVNIIVESRIIPAGDIFFRDTVLPEEKRKILNKGLIPLDLIELRIEDENASDEEKRILHDYLVHNRD
ncbi:MAG: hypothetical protein ACE5GZ_12495 [Gammaproteobacteria bacterium]